MSDKKTPVGDGASLEFDGSSFIVTSDKYADVLTIAPMDYIIQLTRQCDYWKAEAERLHLALSEIAKPALGGKQQQWVVIYLCVPGLLGTISTRLCYPVRLEGFPVHS